MTPRRVIRTYLAINFLFSLSMALIWGVNTLFLMGAGLSIFQVMLANAAFTFGSMVFEIPTGVVADTLGRRVSLLLCLATLFVTTLAYVAIAWVHAGLWPFVAVSVLLGLGFTFYTGAVDAWLVDAMAHVAPGEPLERIFSRGQSAFGAAMLIGTLAGGVLGQVHLSLPYLVRAVLIVPTFFIASTFMKEIGFKPRALQLRRVPEEMRRVFVDGMRFGLRHPVVRPLMFASIVQGSFAMYAFYSWQPYFLDLLGRHLVWINGVIAALIAVSSIVGNFLVPTLSRIARSRSALLIGCVLLQCASAVGAGTLRSFIGVVALYLVHCVATGVLTPVKQGYLNTLFPSGQRATLISLDSLFGDGGAAVGQTGWGYISQHRSIARAWVLGGATLILGVPFYLQARRNDPSHDAFSAPAP